MQLSLVLSDPRLELRVSPKDGGTDGSLFSLNKGIYPLKFSDLLISTCIRRISSCPRVPDGRWETDRRFDRRGLGEEALG